MGALKIRKKIQLNLKVKNKETEVVLTPKQDSDKLDKSFSRSHSSFFSDSDESLIEQNRDKVILNHEECLKIVLKDQIFNRSYL